MILRKLIIQLGFKADIKPLNTVNRLIKGLKSATFLLSTAFAAATFAVSNFIKEAGKLEQVQIAFEVMTKSAAVGKQLMQDLFKFARETPFQIPGILNASRILLGTGTIAKNMTARLTRIGEVAAGLNLPLANLASIFGKVKAAGYLTGFEMERLRRLGVPLSEFLAKKFQATEGEILKMIRNKQISFNEFEEAWSMMVRDRFPNMMKRLLNTFFGLVSNIKDFIFEIKSFAGLELLPVLKKIERQIIFFLQVNKENIILRMQIGFRALSRGIESTWKYLLLLARRFKLIIDQFGGFNRVLKITLSLIGAFVAYKTIIIFGSLALKISSLLNTTIRFKKMLPGLKTFFTGAAFVGLLLILDDIHEFFRGTKEKTLTYELLQFFRKKFPEAMKHTEDALKRLAKLLYHSAAAMYYFSTGKWGKAKEHGEAMKEAFTELTKEQKADIGEVEKTYKKWLKVQPSGPTIRKARAKELFEEVTKVRGWYPTITVKEATSIAQERIAEKKEREIRRERKVPLSKMIEETGKWDFTKHALKWLFSKEYFRKQGLFDLKNLGVDRQVIQRFGGATKLDVNMPITVHNNIPAHVSSGEAVDAIRLGAEKALDVGWKRILNFTLSEVRTNEGV